MSYTDYTFLNDDKIYVLTGDFQYCCAKNKICRFEYYGTDRGLGEKEPPLQGQLIMEGMEYLYE